MSKFFGCIGFSLGPVETSPGVWNEEIIEKMYFGDLNRNSRRLQNASQVNDDLTISNELSIISDPYLENNFHSIRYVKFMGTKWKVTNVDVQFPRLTLTLGGIYNENQT